MRAMSATRRGTAGIGLALAEPAAMRTVFRVLWVASIAGFVACQSGGSVVDGGGGGQAMGGSATGGAAGGHSTGGLALGGQSMGGQATGGSAAGGHGSGGLATGGAGTGGTFVQSACVLAGGTCLTSCTEPCASGKMLAQPNGCPVSESNAVCGARCCLPAGTGGQGGGAGSGGPQGGAGGAGGHSGGSIVCGGGSTVACVGGAELCYSFIGGTAGSETSYSCRAIPVACAAQQTCACVCPSRGGGLGCDFGSLPGVWCSCTESNGLKVSCAGQ